MSNKQRIRKVKQASLSVEIAEPAYQLNDHVQCRIEPHLFIGRVLQSVSLKGTFLYKVAAELPSGITPLAVGQEQIVGLV